MRHQLEVLRGKFEIIWMKSKKYITKYFACDNYQQSTR